MRWVIFLDVDGVLNNHGPVLEILEINARALLWLVREIPELEIVLSSAWRYRGCGPRSTFGQKLSDALSYRESREVIRRVIGQTPPDLEPDPPRTFFERRSDTIRRYLTENPVDGNWIAIDDLEDIETLGEGHFIRTDPSVGFTMKDALKALELLKGQSK